MCHMIFFDFINSVIFVFLLNFLFQEFFSSCWNVILIISFWLSSFLQKMFKCCLFVIAVLDKKSSVSFSISSISTVSVFIQKSHVCYSSVFWSWTLCDCLRFMKKLKKSRSFFLIKNSTCLKLFKLLKSRNIDCIVTLNFFVIVMIN